MAPPNFLSFAAAASSTTTQTLHLPPSSIRLDRENFTLWRTMVISTLEAFELDSHIRADTHPAETRMISNKDGTETAEPNPEFLTWKRSDRFVLLWLKSTLSDTILASVARTTTCYSTWQSLNTTFLSQTKAHRMVLKAQLQTLRKGALSMLDYVEKKRAIADCLAENLHPISDEDLIGYILAGLDSSYGSFKSAFMIKADDLTVDHLIGYLLQEEARLERDLTHDAPLLPTPPASSLPTALTANRFNPNRSHSAGRRSSSSGSSVAARYSSLRSAPRSGPPSSFNRPGEARSPTVICQLCGRANHEAIDCWQRSNLIDYPSRRPPPQRDNHRQAHVAQYGGSSSMVVDPSWYFDTGATDHVTPDISKLTVTEDYNGNDKLQVGNGTSSSSRGHP